MPNGFPGSNGEDRETNPWLGVSHIAGPLNISDEMAESTTRNMLIVFPARNIFQTVIGKAEDEIRQTYPAGKQYLAVAETEEGRADANAFARRGAGAHSWEITKMFSLLLIKI